MAKQAINYTETTIRKMSIKGNLDVDSMTIDADGEIKRISTLLKEYNGADVEMSIQFKTSEILDEPSEDEE